MKLYVIVLFFFPCCLTASEPPWKDMPPKPIAPERSQDFPGVKVIHRGNTPELLAPIARTPAHSNLNVAKRASQEIHIHIEERKDTPSTPANSTEDTENTIPKHRHNRRMIVSNSVSAIVATLVTAGVTLAIHFSNCKK
jgi:hypothetical protein